MQINARGELASADDFGELGKRCGIGAESDGALTRKIDEPARGGPCQSSPKRTVFVSTTIRTGTAFGVRGVDLRLDFLARQGWSVQCVELRERVSEAPRSLVAIALFAGG